MSYPCRLQDASIASLSGSSESLLAANGSRQFLLIQNTGNANIAVNMTGGTASVGGLACITIVANGSLLLDRMIPQDALTVIGTAGQPVTCLWA